MSILVRKNGDVWVRWINNATVTVMRNTARIIYDDGREEVEERAPYPVQLTYQGSQLQAFYDNGSWTLAEIEAVGGRIASPFEVPEGMQVSSGERFEEDESGVHQVFDIEAIPEPPPLPTATEKFDAFLSSIGLTRAEFLAQLT